MNLLDLLLAKTVLETWEKKQAFKHTTTAATQQLLKPKDSLKQ